MRYKRVRPASLAVLALCFFCFLAFEALHAQISGEPGPSPRARARILFRIEELLAKRAFVYGVDFSDWSERIAVESDALARAQSEGEFTRVVNRALGTYGVSHLFLLDPLASMGKEAGYEMGAGFKVIPAPSGSGRLVNVVIPDSPAAKAGLRKGDVLIAVDGKQLDPHSLDYPFSPGGRLLGTTGRERRLQWLRGGESLEASVGFARHKAALPLELSWPNSTTAWITVNSFSASSYSKRTIEGFFAELAKAGAQALVLDLRGNGGGLSEHTNHLASFLTPPGTPMARVFGAEHRVPEGGSLENVGYLERHTDDRGALRFDGPLAILIDRGSGSGGDAFPGVMQQVRGALLIGERTAGALIGGLAAEVGKGFQVVFPIHERLLPDGTRVEGVGVQPDIDLGAVRTTDDRWIEQVALDAVLEALQAGSKPALPSS